MIKKKYKEISLDIDWSQWISKNDFYEKIMQEVPKYKRGW